MWGAPAAGRRAPRTPHCRLRERLFLPDSLLRTAALPDTRLAGFLKVPEIKDGKRFYETRHLSRANPHSDPTTPLGVGHAGAPRGRAGRGKAAPTPCSVTRPLGDVGL